MFNDIWHRAITFGETVILERGNDSKAGVLGGGFTVLVETVKLTEACSLLWPQDSMKDSFNSSCPLRTNFCIFRASLVAQMAKNPPGMLETWFDSWDGKIPWRRECLPTPVFLPWKSHGHRSLEGYSPRGWKELDATERLTCHLISAFS